MYQRKALLMSLWIDKCTLTLFYSSYYRIIFVSCQAVLQTREDLESGYVGGWWLSLGIKSPFVEFTTEIETLSNDTTYFNFTQHMNVIQSKQLQTVTSSSTTPLTTTIAPKTTPAIPKRLTLNIGGQTADFLALFGHHPSLSVTPPTHFTTEMPDRNIRIVETQERAEALQSEPKKYIIPLALKTTSTEKEKKSTVFQDTSLHIDDLKNHILMLQNFAQADKTFQSKFVVFPHLSNETTTSSTTTETPVPPTTTRKKIRINSRNLIRISTTTATPQVFLQNDQSSADDPQVESEEERRKLEKKRRRKERKNLKRTQSLNMAPPSRNHSRKTINKPVRNERDETRLDFKRSKISRNRRASSKLRKKSINTIDLIEKHDSSYLDPKLCYIPDVLSYGQQKLCGTNINVMPVVSKAARAALQNCKLQFKNRRWDCQTIDDPTVFGPVISIGSSEMAYVHALSAASLMSFVARACRDGAFNSCGCSKSKRPKTLKDQWVWGGCGDDFEFAYKFTQRFVDSREKELRRLTRAIVSAPPKEIPKILEQELNLTAESASVASSTTPSEEKHLRGTLVKHKGRKGYNKFNTQLEARSLMNLHNNEAGRRAVVKKSRINCKCHGVSGSCSVITCWQQLTSIKDIAEYLKEKYDSSTQVRMNQRKKLQVRDYRRTIPNAEDLVYIENSPDWCRTKNNWWKGTQGRVCNRNSKGPDSCFGNNICCGRGFNTRKLVVREKCNCKFHWCCTVKCRTCVKVRSDQQ